MKLHYKHSKESETAYLEVTLNHGKQIFMEASCNVRNELNKQRKSNQVVKTIPDNEPYQPRRMPIGLWTVGEPTKRTAPDREPYFIPVDAFIEVPVWDLDADGNYKHVTNKIVTDRAYGIHCSVWGTTLGCIKIHSQYDIHILVALINLELELGKEVLLEVD